MSRRLQCAPLARLAVLALAVALTGCASMRQPPPSPGAVPPPPRSEPAEPTLPTPAPEPEPPTAADSEAGPVPHAVRWVLGAEYRAATFQAFRAAGRELERLAEVLEPGAWAVIADVDETILSNLGYEIELAEASGCDLAFDRESWNRWIERRAAKPLTGAVAFLERVHELGGRVALVTNRSQEGCPATEDNLRAEGVPYDLILCRPAGSDGDKSPRWAMVRDGTATPGVPPLEIVMYLGDNIHDFPDLDQSLRDEPETELADFGALYFVLPNPMYGSFQ